MTALVAALALAIQIALVISGESVLITTGAIPSTAVRLALRLGRDGRLWRVLRLDAIVGIAVTGVVHWFLLRPLLHLHGWSYVTDKMLHVAVPLLAVVGWLLFGPRPRISRRLLLPSLSERGRRIGTTLPAVIMGGYGPGLRMDCGAVTLEW